jgi:hypothetical protein
MLPTGQRAVDPCGNVVLTRSWKLIADNGVERSERRVRMAKKKNKKSKKSNKKK